MDPNNNTCLFSVVSFCACPRLTYDKDTRGALSPYVATSCEVTGERKNIDSEILKRPCIINLQ